MRAKWASHMPRFCELITHDYGKTKSGHVQSVHKENPSFSFRLVELDSAGDSKQLEANRIMIFPVHANRRHEV